MRAFLTLSFLLLSLSSVAQYDAPGFDTYWKLYFPNPYAQLQQNAGPYPSYPYRVDYYRKAFDTGYLPLVWDHNNLCCTIQASGQIWTPTQMLMGVDKLHKKGLSGAGIKIGVIDMGYSGTIPHRAITISASRSTTTSPHCAAVISIIAGRKNDSGRILGSAYNANVYVGDAANMAPAMRWLIDTIGVDLLNMTSLYYPDSEMIAAASRLASRGGVVVVSAGNFSTLDSLNPLVLLPGSISVGSTVGGGVDVFVDSFRHKNILPYQGHTLDFALPCLSVCGYFDGQAVGGSTSGGDGLNFYSVQSGTSFTAPNLTGYLALLLEYFRQYSPCYPASAVARLALIKGRKFTNLGVTATVPTADWLK
jgi:subtilisin family serine protease